MSAVEVTTFESMQFCWMLELFVAQAMEHTRALALAALLRWRRRLHTLLTQGFASMSPYKERIGKQHETQTSVVLCVLFALCGTIFGNDAWRV